MCPLPVVQFVPILQNIAPGRKAAIVRSGVFNRQRIGHQMGAQLFKCLGLYLVEHGFYSIVARFIKLEPKIHPSLPFLIIVAGFFSYFFGARAVRRGGLFIGLIIRSIRYCSAVFSISRSAVFSKFRHVDFDKWLRFAVFDKSQQIVHNVRLELVVVGGIESEFILWISADNYDSHRYQLGLRLVNRVAFSYSQDALFQIAERVVLPGVGLWLGFVAVPDFLYSPKFVIMPAFKKTY